MVLPGFARSQGVINPTVEVSRLVGRVFWVVTVIIRFFWHVAKVAAVIWTLGRVKC